MIPTFLTNQMNIVPNDTSNIIDLQIITLEAPITHNEITTHTAPVEESGTLPNP